MPLTRDEIHDIDCHVQRAGAANCWTGTSGSLAADARRLIRHIQEMTSVCEYPQPHRICVKCLTCLGSPGAVESCPSCKGKGHVFKVNSPAEPHKYRFEDFDLSLGGMSREEYEKRVKETWEKARMNTEYPADHILKGERELRGVDEIDSRKAAAATAVRPGTDKFLAVLQEIADLHMRKSLDYGVDEDALANIRAGGEAIGVDPWKGCVLRISDKMQRLKAFCRRGTCEFDGVEDTLADIAAYAAIALVMVRESAPPPA